MKRAAALFGAALVCGAALAQQPAAPPELRLWPDGAPGSERRHGEAETVRDVYISNVHDPSLTVLRADPRHANGAAVIVVPGGGHRMLVFQNEGMVAAKTLNRIGVTAFVLKYRLARDGDSPYTIEGHAAADLRRALRWVRAHAAQYGVDPERLGAMGFSAGGELVSLVADHAEPAASAASAASAAPSARTRGAKHDAIERQDARPDFQVLVYPGPLGVPATDAKNAPPAFLVAGSRDACCMAPTLALYQQLVAAGVSAELHLYADTDHAFNMGQRGERVSLQHWPDRLADWLADGGWLVPRGGRKPEGVPAP